MPTQYLYGPAIAGSSYKYWERMKTNNRAKRKKPIGLDLLSSPTYYYAHRYDLRHNHDIGWDGIITSPNHGPILADPGRIDYAVKRSVELRSIAKVRSKIKDEKWNLGTFLGELPETQRYFQKVVKEVADLYISVKKRKITTKSLKRLARKGRDYLRRRGLLGTVQDSTGTLSSRWLEWRYAVSPMVYDLQDSLNYLHRSTSRPLISRSAGGAQDTYVLYRRATTSRAAESEIYNLNGRAVAYFRVNPHAQAIKHLGLINLGATLWELTPLSFVVDMFLPVGDFISDMDAMAGVTVLSGTYSVRITGLTSRPDFPYLMWKQMPHGWVSQTGRRGGTSSKMDYYSRAVIGLDVKFSFSKSPTGSQLFDLVALTRQLVLS